MSGQRGEPVTQFVTDAMEIELLATYRRLIAAAYYESETTLDVRHLWSRGEAHFFRVNWRHFGGRHDGEIYRSAFVSIDESTGAPVFCDLTRGRAA